MAEYVVEYKDDGLYRECAKERIVRCRDCASYRTGGKGHAPRCERSIGTFVPSPDGFCAWGERRK